MTTASLALVMALVVVTSATFAWYIYNTSAHTTKIHMAAGASTNLVISDEYDGHYGLSTLLDAFEGRLTPVSTDNIERGFQKVEYFTETDAGAYAETFVQSIYNALDVDKQDYYKTSLFLKTNGGKLDVYVSDMGFENSNEDKPISTAIRIGLVVHEPGQGMAVSGEYIFEIDKGHHAESGNNTYKIVYEGGTEGCVLDSTKTDGSLVDFTDMLLDSGNFCSYDDDTGAVTLSADSTKLCQVEGAANGEYGTPVQVDVYIYLEGCDEDCTNAICSQTLKNIALSFAGYPVT